MNLGIFPLIRSKEKLVLKYQNSIRNFNFHEHPCIIISFLVVGKIVMKFDFLFIFLRNPYPVTENPNDENTINGISLKIAARCKRWY